jgi:hypothetical protein
MYRAARILMMLLANVARALILPGLVRDARSNSLPLISARLKVVSAGQNSSLIEILMIFSLLCAY